MRIAIYSGFACYSTECLWYVHQNWTTQQAYCIYLRTRAEDNERGKESFI